MDLYTGFVDSGRMVFGQSFLQMMLGSGDIGEKGYDLLIGNGAESTQESSDRKFPLAIDADIDSAVEISLKLDPGSATWNNLGSKSLFTLQFLGGEGDSGRTSELWHYHALDTRDDEGAVRGHEWEISHEDFLLLLCIHNEVLQSHSHLQRRLV